MLYFCKLNLNFNLGEINTDHNKLRSMGVYSAPQKYGVALNKTKDFVSVPNSVYFTEEDIKSVVYAQLPKSLLSIEEPKINILAIQPPNTEKKVMLAPHVDLDRKCAINYYIDTHQEKTTYYKYKAAKIYEVDHFIAKDNECWLLDVSTPHSVELCPPYVRKAVAISFIHTAYNEVLKHLC